MTDYTTITISRNTLNRLRTTNPNIVGAGKKIDVLLDIFDAMTMDEPKFSLNHNDDDLTGQLTECHGNSCRAETFRDQKKRYEEYCRNN